jgi:hypothetical protein
MKIDCLGKNLRLYKFRAFKFELLILVIWYRTQNKEVEREKSEIAKKLTDEMETLK